MITVEKCKNMSLFRVVDSEFHLNETVETTYMVRLGDADEVISETGAEVLGNLRLALLAAISEVKEREAGRKKFLALVAEFEENK